MATATDEKELDGLIEPPTFGVPSSIGYGEPDIQPPTFGAPSVLSETSAQPGEALIEPPSFGSASASEIPASQDSQEELIQPPTFGAPSIQPEAELMVPGGAVQPRVAKQYTDYLREKINVARDKVTATPEGTPEYEKAFKEYKALRRQIGEYRETEQSESAQKDLARGFGTATGIGRAVVSGATFGLGGVAMDKLTKAFGEDDLKKAISESSNVNVALGILENVASIPSSLLLGRALQSTKIVGKFAGALKGTKIPFTKLKVPPTMALGQATRGITALLTSGTRNTISAIEGDQSAGKAVTRSLLDVASAMVSVLPEGLVGPGIANFAAQVGTDLAFDAVADVFTDKNIAARLAENETVSGGLWDWFAKDELQRLVVTAAFAGQDLTKTGREGLKAMQAEVKGTEAYKTAQAESVARAKAKIAELEQNAKAPAAEGVPPEGIKPGETEPVPRESEIVPGEPRKFVIGEEGETTEIPRPEPPPEQRPPTDTQLPGQEDRTGFGPTTGLKNSESERIRNAIDLDAVPKGDVSRFMDRLDDAKAKGLDRNAEITARSLIETKRAPTEEEFAGMVVRTAQLEDDYEITMRQIESEVNAGKPENAHALDAKLDAITDSLDLMTRASTIEGTRAGRILNIRKMQLQREQYTLAGITRAATVAKKGQLNAEERKQFGDYAGRIKEAEARIEQLSKTVEEYTAKEAEAAAAKVVKEEAETTKSRRNVKKAVQDRSDLKKELASLGVRVNDITGLTADGARIIGKIAATYIREGVSNLGEVVQRVRLDIPDASDRQVWDSLAGRLKSEKSRAQSETQKRVNEIRKQAKIMGDLDRLVNRIQGTEAPEPAPVPKTPQQRMRETIRIESLFKQLRADVRTGEKNAARLAAVMEKIADAENQLKTGDRPAVETRGAAPESKRIATAKERLTELRQIIKKTDAIAEIEKIISEGGRRSPRKPAKAAKVKSSELRALDKQLDDLRGIVRATEREDATHTRIQEKIDRVQEQLRGGQRDVLIPKAPEAERVRIARKELTELQTLLRTNDKIASLENQLKTGDYEVTPQRQKVIHDDELARAQAKLHGLRLEVSERVRNLRPMSGWDKFKESRSLPRALMATADHSYILRQGIILSPLNPKIAAHAAWGAEKAFFSKNSAIAIDSSMRTHPLHARREQAELYLPLPVGAKLSDREEMFASRVAQKIPGVARSERHMVVGLNLLRAGVFDEFVRTNPAATDADLRAVADFINVASGRGNLESMGNATKVLSELFFSPRFAISRLQAAGSVVKHWKNPAARKMIAKNYASYVGFGMSVMGLAKLAGFEVGLDPEDSDFGKIIIGNTRFDVWGGSAQLARLMAGIVMAGGRTVTGKPPRKDVNLYRDIGRFFLYKLSPQVTFPVDVIGGKNVIGKDVTPTQAVVERIVPMFLRDVKEVMENEKDPKKVLGLSAGAFLGAGISSYDDEMKRPRYKRMFKKANYTPGKRVWPAEVQENEKLRKEIDVIFSSAMAMAIESRGDIKDMNPTQLKDFLVKTAAKERQKILSNLEGNP